MLQKRLNFLAEMILVPKINEFIGEFGEVVSLQIDIVKKNIIGQVLLKGEDKPLDFKIKGLKLIEKDGNFYITYRKIKTSREWINIVANKYAPKEILIPEKYNHKISFIKTFLTWFFLFTHNPTPFPFVFPNLSNFF